MLAGYLLTAFYLALAGVTLARLPALHPAQLWAMPWAIATFLYSLRLLPYEAIDPPTAILAAGAGAAFCGGTVLGSRVSQKPVATDPGHADRGRIALATTGCLLLAAVMFIAFLGEVATNVGVHDALTGSVRVREAIGTGEFSATIKYTYPAIAAAMLAALAAGRSADRLRFWWWIASLAAIGSLYFSTGRSTILLAAIGAIVTYVLASGTRISKPALLGGTYCAIALALAGHVAIGSLQDRPTVESSATEVPSPLRGTDAQVLILPYEYASAPIAALNERVAAADLVGGANGCATLRVLCRGLNRVNLVDGGRSTPALGFTAKPLPWNTYTALDLPLDDGGIILSLPMIALTGLAVGCLWGIARRGQVLGIILYALAAAATVYSIVQYNFLASHLVGAGLISTAMFALAGVPSTRSLRARLATA
jgi:hypothetical protein